MDNRLKRFLSLALAIIMVIGMMPANVVFATGNVEGQDPAQVETPTQETTAPSESEQASEADETEETTVHICSFDTEEITKAESAREAGQKTLSCSCGAFETVKICAGDCQLTEGHEGDCVLACDRNPGCIEDEGHDSPCVSEDGALLIGSAEELEVAMAAIADRNAVVFTTEALTTNLTLTADVMLTKTYEVPAGYSITLDLAGYTMSASGMHALHNKGILIINDSTRESEGKTVNGKINTSGNFVALYNEGTATVNGGVFTSTNSYALDNRKGATMTVTGGSASGINNYEGTVNISGGSHYNKANLGHVLRNYNGTMNITGGSYRNDNSQTETVLAEGGALTVSGDDTLFTIKAANETELSTAPLFDIKALAGGTITSVTISGGRFEGGFRVGAATSLTINDGYFHDIHKSAYTVADDGKEDKVTIYGGNFQDTNAQAFAAQNLEEGFIVMSNGNEVVKDGDKLSPVVAKIKYQNGKDDYGYASLAQAVALAYDGATIIMHGNDTVNGTINVDKNLTIELGSYKITSNVNDGYIFHLEGDDCDTFTLKDGVFVSDSTTDLGVININAAASVVVEGGTYGDANKAFETNSGAIFNGKFVGSNEYASIELKKGVKVYTNHYVFNSENAAMSNVTVDGGNYTSTAYGAFVVDVINNVSFQDAEITGNLLGVAVQGRHATQKATASFANNTIKVPNPTGSADIGKLKGFVIAVSSNVNATVESGSYGNNDDKVEQIGLLPDSSGNSLLIKNGTFNGTVSAPSAAGAVEIRLGTFNNFKVSPQNSDKLTITVAGGKFDTDPTYHLLPTLEWIPVDKDGVADADKGKVKEKDVRVTNTDTAPVLGVEDRIKVQGILDQIKYSYALRDNTPLNVPQGGTLKIALEKLVVDEDLVPTEIVYDVDVEGATVNNNVTFHMPVPSAVLLDYVKVYHGQDLLGVFPVKTSEPSKEKYVEVVSSKFTDDYTLIPVEYENGINVYIGTNGYETLDKALEAAEKRIEEAAESEKESLKTIVVEIIGNVEFSARAKSFKKITFNGIDGNQAMDMVIGDTGAAFITDGEMEFNHLTLNRPDPEPAGRRDHHFYVRGGLTYNDCKLYGLFNVSEQNTTFNRCEFWNRGTGNRMNGEYALWLYNSKGVVVNVIDCKFFVTNRAIKMYAHKMAGNMTLNISGTEFVAEKDQSSKTVVEMTFEDCDGNAVMLLNIDDKSYKHEFGAPEHIAAITESNSWFNSEIRGTDTVKGAVVTVAGSTVYSDCEAKIGDQYYTTLEKAIAAAEDGDIIHLLKDTNADVTIKQEAGKSFTIDGSLNGFYSSGLKKDAKAVFGGTMFLQGDSRYEGAETLTIQNVKFSTSETKHDFISCDNGRDSTIRYAHNVTISNCSFECESDESYNEVVGMRFSQCYDVTVDKCSAKNMFLLMWANSNTGMIISDCYSAEGTTLHEGGVNVGTSKNVQFDNCNFKGKDYGIRADGSAATTLTIKDSKLTADIPVYIRNVTAENYTLVMEGANTLNPAEGKTGIVLNKAGTITGAYDDEQPTVRAIVELNGTGLNKDDITGEVQTSGKRNFTKATEAAIGKVYFDKLTKKNEGAIESAQTGDTIDLLCDIETTATISCSKNITINGKLQENEAPYSIKAKTGTTWSTSSPYLLKTSNAVTLKDIIIDGNSVGCRGIQLTGSKSDVTLENVTVENITADTDGCDYAIMADTRNLTIKGNLKFDGCKYGRMVVGSSIATKATVASGATLTNVKVNLEKINIKTQVGSELIVAKNAKYDVQTHVKGHHVVYDDEHKMYELQIDNTLVLDNAFAMQDANRSRIYIELLDVYVGNIAEPADSKITVELYTESGELISTTTNIPGSDADLPCVEDVLGVNIVLGGEANTASSSWNTVFEKGHPRADMPASYYKLFLNGSEDPYTDAQFADGKVPVLYSGIADQNPVAWEDLKYINRVIKQTKDETTNEITSEFYTTLSEAVRAAADGDTLKLLGNVIEQDAVTIDEKITLNLNGKTVSRDGLTDGYALLLIVDEVEISNGTVQINGAGTAIWANDTSNLTLTNVNVVGVTAGINLYKTAKVTVNNSGNYAISGKDAVRIYGGELTVTGGKVTGTDHAIITSVNSSEANVGTATVNISNGTITGKIVLEDKDSNHNIPEVYRADVIITGGEFLNSELDQNDVSKVYFGIAASGGTFDKEVPITMCAAGYFCEKIENSDPVRYHVIENPGCRIDLSAVDADNKVVIGENAYVDGKAYEVQPGKVIVLDKEMAKTPYMFITTHTYAKTDNDDERDDYPEHMYVWFAEGTDANNDKIYESYNVKRFDMLDDFFMYNGTSIRIGSDMGIRFISSVDAEDIGKLMDGDLITEGTLSNAVLTEMGTEFWKTNRLRSLVYGKELNYRFSIYKTVEGRNRFTGPLTNLDDSEAVVAEPFFSRPYAVMEFGDEGEEMTITLYGGTLKRSIYFVAQQVDEAGSFKGTPYDSSVQKLLQMGEAYNKEQAEGDNANGSEGGTGGSESTNSANS